MPKRSTTSLSPEYALMGLLAQQPAHGYDLHQRLLADLGQVWHISQSQLYNLLKRLETQADIVAALVEQPRRPDRRVFQLTDRGRTRFEKWLGTPTGSSIRAIRVEFITRLYFISQSSPGDVDALIDIQVEETSRGVVRLQKMLAELDPEQVFNRLGLELRINQLSSILDWLDKCRSAIHRQIDTPKQELL